jgi:GPI ethanolamine phosphate transferase 3 subunit O
LLKELDDSNFTLLISHVIGVDHAGHTYSASHSEIERKLNDTESLIRDIIDKMDNDTVLLVFGDHGMTDDGNHGGASLNELRSVLFSYTKHGFPVMKHSYKFDEIDLSVKQIDIASIVCHILGVPLPFQNLGIIHPYFYMQ